MSPRDGGEQMTLILSDAEIGALLTMPDCLARLEQTYLDLSERQAVNRPRTDLYGPTDQPDARYVFKSMDGLLPRYHVAALRLNSDVIRWQATATGIRKDKEPTGPAGKHVGLILLFSTRTGEPLAILPERAIQRMRVGATNGLAARYLAAPDAQVYGLLGSGWQASGQIMAMAAVRPLREVRVYSPNRAHRARFAAEMAERLGLDVRPVEEPRAAVRGADIVGTATNSLGPVLDAAWLEPHAHVTSVTEQELDPAIFERGALVVVHVRAGKPAAYVVGHGEEPIYAQDPLEALGGALHSPRPAPVANRVDLTQQPDLAMLIAGQVALPPPGSGTCFVNAMGLGVQFAALGALAVERARERGLGRELALDGLPL
jgi:ornithine cyclodeaminase/alanine dehydrogenase-like protein (mu-crystallin family)